MRSLWCAILGSVPRNSARVTPRGGGRKGSSANGPRGKHWHGAEMTMRSCLGVVVALASLMSVHAQPGDTRVELGPRPALLVADLPDGELKSRLQACVDEPAKRTA